MIDTLDRDDGLTEEEGDCDDRDPATNPTGQEFPDGLDNNCDGQIDEGTSLSMTTGTDLPKMRATVMMPIHWSIPGRRRLRPWRTQIVMEKQTMGHGPAKRIDPRAGVKIPVWSWSWSKGDAVQWEPLD